MNGRVAILINIALRGAILVSKFFFIFAAARFLSLEELGTYGLIGATVGYALYLLGMDFYTFATREVIGIDGEQQGRLILDQFRLYLVTFTVFFLPLLAIFWGGLLDWRWVFVFYALLLFEHLSQEMTRVIIALGNPLVASLQLFVRSASWAYVALLLFFIEPATRSIEWVLYLWLAASALSVAIGAWQLRFVPWLTMFARPMPTEWWWQGLKIAFPFLLSTLAIRAVFTLDRYAVEWLDGLAMVGVYAVYIGLCNAMLSFMDAAVFQFTYPRLVGLVKSGDREGFRKAMRRFTLQSLASIAFCLTGLVVLTELVLGQLGKPEYIKYLPVFWWLLAAYVLLVISYVPHYGLYALRQDRWIFFGHVAPLAVFLVGLVSLDFSSGLFQVAVALIIAFTVSLMIKVVGFIRPYRQFLKTEDSTVHV